MNEVTRRELFGELFSKQSVRTVGGSALLQVCRLLGVEEKFLGGADEAGAALAKRNHERSSNQLQGLLANTSTLSAVAGETVVIVGSSAAPLEIDGGAMESAAPVPAEELSVEAAPESPATDLRRDEY